MDLTGQITQLRTAAPALPDPGLARLAHEHAQFLTQLAAQTELLCRQVLLVWREPATPDHPTPTPGSGRRGWRRRRRGFGAAARRAAEERLLRRVGEAAELLAPLGVSVTPLNPDQTVAVLTVTANPGLPRPTAPTFTTAPPLTGPDSVAGEDTGWRAGSRTRCRLSWARRRRDRGLNQRPDVRQGWAGGRR